MSMQVIGLLELVPAATANASATATVAGLNVTASNTISATITSVAMRVRTMLASGGMANLLSIAVVHALIISDDELAGSNVAVMTTRVRGSVGLCVGAAVGNGVQNLKDVWQRVAGELVFFPAKQEVEKQLRLSCLFGKHL
jgi:predicted nucleic acid-binding protein